MIQAMRVRPLNQWCAPCLGQPHDVGIVGMIVYVYTDTERSGCGCGGKMWQITDESDIAIDKVAGRNDHEKYGRAWMCEHVIEPVAD